MPNPKFEELAEIFSQLSVGASISQESRQAAYKAAAQVFSELAEHEWAAPTGNESRATFDPATVTLPQLAERVAALIKDLVI